MCAHVPRKMLERLPATCERGRRWLEVRISRRRKSCVGELDVRRWVQSLATCPNVTAMTSWSEEGGAAAFKQGAACLKLHGWKEGERSVDAARGDAAAAARLKWMRVDAWLPAAVERS